MKPSGRVVLVVVANLALCLGADCQWTGPPPRDVRGRADSTGVELCGGLRMVVTFDNYRATEGTVEEWGFSCLIEGHGETVLFDTGASTHTLEHNLAALHIDPDAIDAIVISHAHLDHTGGLDAVLRPHHTVYLLESFPDRFRTQVEAAGATAVLVGGPRSICSGIDTTGTMGASIPEQSLIIDSPCGPVVLTGCAHPGIVSIVERAVDLSGAAPHLVAGGFHLSSMGDPAVDSIISRFRELGVERAGPTHCTGDHAIELFRQEYGGDFVEMGTGRVIDLSGDCGP